MLAGLRPEATPKAVEQKPSFPKPGAPGNQVRPDSWAAARRPGPDPGAAGKRPSWLQERPTAPCYCQLYSVISALVPVLPKASSFREAPPGPRSGGGGPLGLQQNSVLSTPSSVLYTLEAEKPGLLKLPRGSNREGLPMVEAQTPSLCRSKRRKRP